MYSKYRYVQHCSYNIMEQEVWCIRMNVIMSVIAPDQGAQDERGAVELSARGFQPEDLLKKENPDWELFQHEVQPDVQRNNQNMIPDDVLKKFLENNRRRLEKDYGHRLINELENEFE